MDLLCTSNAIINLTLVKRDFFISSFPGKLIFGEIFEYKYIRNKSFLIYRCEICKFYETTLAILKSISSSKDTQQCWIQTEDYAYFWELKNETNLNRIILGIEIASNVVFKTLFTFEEFYNLLDYFKELILTSLLLRDREISIINEISCLEIAQIKQFENKNLLNDYLDKQKIEKTQNMILISLNLDFIILQNKFNKLINIDYRKNYTSMLKE